MKTKDDQIIFKVSAIKKGELKAEAAKRGISLSALITISLNDYLNK